MHDANAVDVVESQEELVGERLGWRGGGTTTLISSIVIPSRLWLSWIYFTRDISMHSNTRWIRPSQFSTSVNLLSIRIQKTHLTIFGWSKDRSTEISRREVLGMPSLLSSTFTFFIATTSPVKQSIALNLACILEENNYTTP